MISKTEFLALTDNELEQYIADTYCMSDVNDACADFVLEELSEDLDEYETLLCENFPFDWVLDSLSGEPLREYLWEKVVMQCEEIDDDYEEVEEDEEEMF